MTINDYRGKDVGYLNVSMFFLCYFIELRQKGRVITAVGTNYCGPVLSRCIGFSEGGTPIKYPGKNPRGTGEINYGLNSHEIPHHADLVSLVGGTGESLACFFSNYCFSNGYFLVE